MVWLNRDQVFRGTGSLIMALALLFGTMQVASACGSYSCHHHHHPYHPYRYHHWHNGAAVVAGVAVGALIAAAVTSQQAPVFQPPAYQPIQHVHRTCVTRYDRYGKYYHCTEYY